MTSAGTLESAWTDWAFLGSLPTVGQPTGRVVVVSAHPDDEVLGAGGLLATMAWTASPPPRFVTVSDGESSHPGLSTHLVHELGEQRAAELRDGLRALGYPNPDVTRLQLPDSAIADHVDELAGRLQSMIDAADLVLCPAQTDGHVDHATVGRVTAEVCAGIVPVWEFPIWIWHWTNPSDPDVAWERGARFAVTPQMLARKRRALACFTSQVAPLSGDGSQTVILPPEVLEHFDRPYEVFFA